jgi:hypothetical protein
MASGNGSFIGGGVYNKTSSSTSDPVVVGGEYNEIKGGESVACAIVGGYSNVIDNSLYSFIGGGYDNSVIVGSYNVIAGGDGNTTSGNYSANIGGRSNFSNKDYNLTWGNQSRAVHHGATVLSDQRAINKYSHGPDSFNLFYTGGAILSGTPLYVIGAEAVASGRFAIGMANVPTDAGSVGRKGEITFNSTSGFLCVDTNTWRAFPLYSTFTPPLPTTAAVSNEYGFVFGAGTDNYDFVADDTWETVTFSATSPSITIPATAGTANYVLDAIVRYKGSSDTFSFRFYNTTDSSVVSNSLTVSPSIFAANQVLERVIKVPFSTSATKTIVLQAHAVLGLTYGESVVTGTQISYMRMT